MGVSLGDWHLHKFEASVSLRSDPIVRIAHSHYVGTGAGRPRRLPAPAPAPAAPRTSAPASTASNRTPAAPTARPPATPAPVSHQHHMPAAAAPVHIGTPQPHHVPAAAAAATPHPAPSDAVTPRPMAGTGTKHTCGGHIQFGRPNDPANCPRCAELAAGAPGRRWVGKSRAERDAEDRQAVAAHFASAKHRNGGCGPVCTFGEH